MIPIQKEQEVYENNQYKSSIGGDFDPLDFVPCQRKTEEQPGTCTFLAQAVTRTDPTNESSN
jgi:hypothetical protein